MVAHVVKNLPAIQETQVQSLGQEDLLEKGTATCLENPMDRGAWRTTVHGVAESDRTEWLTLSLSPRIVWEIGLESESRRVSLLPMSKVRSRQVMWLALCYTVSWWHEGGGTQYPHSLGFFPLKLVLELYLQGEASL